MPVTSEKFNVLNEMLEGCEPELDIDIEEDTDGIDLEENFDVLHKALMTEVAKLGYGAQAVLQNVETHIKKGAPSPIPMKPVQRLGMSVMMSEKLGSQLNTALSHITGKLASIWKKGKGDVSEGAMQDAIRIYFILGAAKDLVMHATAISKKM